MSGQNRLFIGWLASVPVWLICAAAVAQDGGAAQPPPNQGAGQPGAAGAGRGAGGRSGLVRQLAKQLDLTDEQQQQVEDISKAHFEKLRNRPGMTEQREKLRKLRDDMNAAREAGDMPKFEELRKQMQEASMQSRQQNQDAMAELYGEVEKVLTPEQKQKFTAMRERWTARPVSLLDEPMSLRRAVFNLKLGVEQREKIEALFKEYRQSAGALTEGDRETKAEMGRKLKDNVLKELTEEQRAELIEAENLHRKRGGGRAAGAGLGK